MARPGCGSSSCPFFLTSTNGLDISGEGSLNTPWELDIYPYIGGMYTYSTDAGWNMMPEQGVAATSTAITSNTMFLTPFSMSRRSRTTLNSFRITDLMIDLSAAATAGTMRAGIYKSGVSNTMDLAHDFGANTAGGNMTTTGAKTWTLASWPGSANFGIYQMCWMAVVFQGVTGTPAMRVRSTWARGVVSSTPDFTSNPTAYTVAGVSGALPASVNPLPTSIAVGPAMAFRSDEV